ncbi:CapA family protein [Paenibacillus sp. GCM10027627]|uniref:CapA family protein n=1 Tax=unclassified Paenibacillus TaxID=185978 RepID=UPI00363B2AF8
MRRKKTWITAFTVLSLLTVGLAYLWIQPLFGGESGGNGQSSTGLGAKNSSTETAIASATPTPEPTPAEPVYTEAVWIGVGDIMSHSPQLPGAYDAQTKTYNFKPYFEHVKPVLSGGDWIMANLETPIAGPDFGYTGYPTFNAPIELAEALKDAGFNLLSTANNHSLDKREQGLLKTLDHLKGLGLQAVGTAASQEEAAKPVIVEKNGIKMGFLAYTYGTNGIPIPEGKPYLVNMIDEVKIIADIQTLKQSGADLVSVSLHFGNEYQTEPSEEQKKLARSLVAAGADIIAGSHPHVVQPYEVIETTDANGEVKRSLIIYSMGNFISNQRGDSKDYGVIFKVGIRKNSTAGTATVTEVEAIPTWVHRYKPDRSFRYRILPIKETLAAKNDKLLKAGDYETMQNDYDMLVTRLDSMK